MKLEEIKIIDKVKIEIEEMKKNPTQEKAQALFEKGKLQNKKLTIIRKLNSIWRT